MYKNILTFFLIFLAVHILWEQFIFADGLKGPHNFIRHSEKKNMNVSLFSYPVLFFKKYISSIDSNRCPMYPSCSTYSLLCLKKHGSIIGWFMTCDRLLHEPDEIFLSKLIHINENYYYYDPVENNDFWWCKSK